MEYLYRQLPSGNQDDYPELDAELLRRGVNASFLATAGGGRIYRIPTEDLGKLPHEDGEPYLGDDRSGYSLYPARHNFVKYAQEIGIGDWTPIR